MAWQWRTTPEGFVDVDRNGEPGTCNEFQTGGGLLPPAGTFERLAFQETPLYQKAVAKVLAWRALAEKHAARTGLPLPWILAFVFTESQGNPNAMLQEPSGAVGVGLMALTATPAGFPGKFGITYQQAFDPDLNMTAGTDLMVKFRAGKLDLPQLASVYNSGPGRGGMPYVSLRSRWGMREYCGPPPTPENPNPPVHCCHIERLVRANNTMLAALAGAPPVPLPGPHGALPPATPSTAGRVLGMLAAGVAAFYGVRYLRRRRAW
jgi:hypothetical protein